MSTLRKSLVAVLVGGLVFLGGLRASRAADAASTDAAASDSADLQQALAASIRLQERLKRPEEALASYDQALVADPFHTQAHLAKGGVYNQLERFNEALDCFEQAIKTQQRVTA